MVKIIRVMPCEESSSDLQVKVEVDGNIIQFALCYEFGGTSMVLGYTAQDIKKHLFDLRLGEGLEFQLSSMEKVFPGAWYGVFGRRVQPLMNGDAVEIMKYVDGVYIMKIGEDIIEFLVGDSYHKPRFAKLNGTLVVGSDPRDTTNQMTPSSVFDKK